ncbi:MAG: ABC transporter ATP-binding protein [Candidatus Bathyarchaeia archaeon]
MNTISPHNAPAVQTINVTKDYNVGNLNYPALRGVSMKIEKGELTSIIGPSGSGKSTLLNLIGALDKPTSGRVLVDGFDLRKLSEQKLALLRNRRIGFIFQSFNLISRLSAIKNVEMPLVTRGIPKPVRRQLSMKALKAVGLEKIANKRPTQLSGGQQQRVAVARALVTKPALVIGDEPTGNLDSKTTMDILNLIVQMNRDSRTTFVLVTHNPEVAAVTQRVIRLRDGMIEKDERTNRIDSFLS